MLCGSLGAGCFGLGGVGLVAMCKSPNASFCTSRCRCHKACGCHANSTRLNFKSALSVCTLTWSAAKPCHTLPESDSVSICTLEKRGTCFKAKRRPSVVVKSQTTPAPKPVASVSEPNSVYFSQR